MNTRVNALVAVVDDDRRVLESIEDLLASAGYTAQVFSSAQEFLDSKVLTSIGCLVSDIRMPGIDGWELESIASRQRPELPVILITGHDDSRCEAEVRKSMRTLFTKPFDGQELLATIKASLQSQVT